MSQKVREFAEAVGGQAVWAGYVANMQAQGRTVQPERLNWERLAEQDKQLDYDIAMRVVRAFLHWQLWGFDLRQIQAENREWVEKNFPNSDPAPHWAILGAVEEVGELSHAYLKSEHGIRGTTEEHEAKMRDAVGDAVVFLAQFCTRMGWDFQEVVDSTWQEVKQRDWQKNKAGVGYGKPQ